MIQVIDNRHYDLNPEQFGKTVNLQSAVDSSHLEQTKIYIRCNHHRLYSRYSDTD